MDLQRRKIVHVDIEISRLRECMTEASEAVLGDGKVCRVDAEIIRYPDRFKDEHGQDMWDKIMSLLERIQG